MQIFKVIFKNNYRKANDVTMTVIAEDMIEALWKLVELDIGGKVDRLEPIKEVTVHYFENSEHTGLGSGNTEFGSENTGGQ